MINLDDCVQLGFLTKPHGIKGHLVLKLTDFSFEEIEEMELVFIIVDGLPVPFFIEEFSERNNDTLLIKLEDLNSEPEAKKYSESVVYIERSVLVNSNSEGTNVNAYKGFIVIDKELGEIGIFDSILDYDKNPIMRVLKQTTEILIPYNPEFIIDVNEDDRKFFVECPEGLLDLYL